MFVRPNGVEGTWAFFNLVFVQNLCIFIVNTYSINDQEALPILYDLIENEGLSMGTSCGINIAGAIRLGKELGAGKTIVTIRCDRSDKYSTKMFIKKFLEEKGLHLPNWL